MRWNLRARALKVRLPFLRSLSHSRLLGNFGLFRRSGAAARRPSPLRGFRGRSGRLRFSRRRSCRFRCCSLTRRRLGGRSLGGSLGGGRLRGGGTRGFSGRLTARLGRCLLSAALTSLTRAGSRRLVAFLLGRFGGSLLFRLRARHYFINPRMRPSVLLFSRTLQLLRESNHYNWSSKSCLRSRRERDGGRTGASGRNVRVVKWMITSLSACMRIARRGTTRSLTCKGT